MGHVTDHNLKVQKINSYKDGIILREFLPFYADDAQGDNWLESEEPVAENPNWTHWFAKRPIAMIIVDSETWHHYQAYNKICNGQIEDQSVEGRTKFLVSYVGIDCKPVPGKGEKDGDDQDDKYRYDFLKAWRSVQAACCKIGVVMRSNISVR